MKNERPCGLVVTQPFLPSCRYARIFSNKCRAQSYFCHRIHCRSAGTAKRVHESFVFFGWFEQHGLLFPFEEFPQVLERAVLEHADIDRCRAHDAGDLLWREVLAEAEVEDRLIPLGQEGEDAIDC